MYGGGSYGQITVAINYRRAEKFFLNKMTKSIAIVCEHLNQFARFV